ncbi:MAG: hypothetical protein NZ870_02155, partial [bacterium]|nr:hypothetical protein [bacterium]
GYSFVIYKTFICNYIRFDKINKRRGSMFLFLIPLLLSDEIVRKDTGEILQGKIVEVKTGEYYKIRTTDGRLFKINWDNVESVKFEEQPTYQAPTTEYEPKKSYVKNWFVMKLGFDSEGMVTGSIYGKEASLDVNSGVSFSMEFLSGIDRTIEFGVGITAQSMRGFKNNPQAEFAFFPIYGVLNLKLAGDQSFTPYLRGQLGLSIFTESYTGSAILEPGLHFAFGAGMYLSEILFEFLYSIDNGAEVYPSNLRVDFTYTKLSINIGYRF